MSDYTAIELGELATWGEGGERPGKRFIDGDLGATSVGLSVNSTEPGGEAPFWHSHERSEEIYVFITGRGQFAVGDEVIDVGPGTTVRVAPGASHHLRALPESTEPMKWLCIRGAHGAIESTAGDATLDQETPTPWSA